MPVAPPSETGDTGDKSSTQDCHYFVELPTEPPRHHTRTEPVPLSVAFATDAPVDSPSGHGAPSSIRMCRAPLSDMTEGRRLCRTSTESRTRRIVAELDFGAEERGDGKTRGERLLDVLAGCDPQFRPAHAVGRCVRRVVAGSRTVWWAHGALRAIAPNPRTIRANRPISHKTYLGYRN